MGSMSDRTRKQIKIEQQEIEQQEIERQEIERQRRLAKQRKSKKSLKNKAINNAKNKAKKKIKEGAKKVFTKFILPYLPYIFAALGIILLVLIILFIISWLLGFFTGDGGGDNNKQEEVRIEELFKYSPENKCAVLDEVQFMNFIKSKNLTGVYNKGDGDSSDDAETDQDKNVVDSSDYSESDPNKYSFLKQVIVKINASSYPDDWEFVLNKTLSFEDGENSEDQDTIDKKIKKIKNQLGTITVYGGISIYRNSTGNKLKYRAPNDELDESSYTIKDNQIIVPSVEKNKSEVVGSGDGSGTHNYDEKPFDYRELISPYIMPLKFITELYMLTQQSEHFLLYVSQLVSHSHIDLIVYEDITESHLDMKETYEITEKDTGNTEKETKKTTQDLEAKNLKMYILNVENWVATIKNKYKEVEGDQEKIYNNYGDGKEFTVQTYEELLKSPSMQKYGANELKEAIKNRLNKFKKEIGYKEDPETGELIETSTKLKSQLINLTAKTKTYKLSEEDSVKEDNTDYFCGLLKNKVNNKISIGNFSISNGVHESHVYSFNNVNNILGLASEISDILITSSFKSNFGDIKKKFHKFDPDGNEMYYFTASNKLVCPYSELANYRETFLQISEGKFDETINLIWDKLYGEKNNKIDKEINHRQFENEDINNTFSANVVNYIKSWEGTTTKTIDGIVYHVSYIDRNSIPTTGWGINLFQTFDKFEKYLGEIVYTPAFYMAAKHNENTEDNSFIIPDNIVQIVFEEILEIGVNAVRNKINSNNNISYKYNLTQNEEDTLLRVSHSLGNYGPPQEYIKTINEALNESKRANSSDRTDREKLFIYYDYIKTHLKTKEGVRYFMINDEGDTTLAKYGIKASSNYILYATRIIL